MKGRPFAADPLNLYFSTEGKGLRPAQAPSLHPGALGIDVSLCHQPLDPFLLILQLMRAHVSEDRRFKFVAWPGRPPVIQLPDQKALVRENLIPREPLPAIPNLLDP